MSFIFYYHLLQKIEKTEDILIMILRHKNSMYVQSNFKQKIAIIIESKKKTFIIKK